MPLDKRSGASKFVRSSSGRTFLLGVLLLSLLSLLSTGESNVNYAEPLSPGNRALTPQSVIAFEVSGRESQTASISLNAGELLQVSIEKGDLPSSITIYDSTRRKLAQRSSRRYEVVEMALVAISSRPHTVEIYSQDEPQQRQTIRITTAPIKVAGATERQRVQALENVALAELLAADWTNAQMLRSINKLSEARAIWLSQRDFERASTVAMTSGELYMALGNYRDALENYRLAKTDAKLAGNRQRESEAQAEIGRVLSYLGKNDQAQFVLKRELQRYRARTEELSPPLKRAHAIALANLGEVSYSRGDLVSAAGNFQDSLKLFTEVGDRFGEARCRLFTGYLQASFGRIVRAREEFSRALALYKSLAHRSGEALSLTAIGLTTSRSNGDESAISLHTDAMSIFRSIGDRQSEAITLNAQGQAYENLKQYRLALERYQEALKLGQANQSLDFISSALYQIAGVYRLMGDRKQALSYYEQCLKVSRATGKKRAEANALAEIASLYAATGDWYRAVKQFDRTIRFYRSVSDHRGEAIALNNLGDLLLSVGRNHESLDAYKRALALARQVGDNELEISTLYSSALATRASGKPKEALQHVEESISIIEDSRLHVSSLQFRSTYFAGVRKNYALFIDLLMQLEREQPGKGFAMSALEVNESARARSLLEILSQTGANVREGADPELLAREQELEGMLRYQALYQLRLANEPHSSIEAAEVSRQMDSLKAQYEAVQSKLLAPVLHNLSLVEPVTRDELLQELNDGETMLLSYFLGEERSYLWAVTKDSFRSYELPPRRVLEEAAHEIITALTARQTDGSEYHSRVEAAEKSLFEKSAKLSDLLLPPLAERRGPKRLLVVSDGALQNLPFDFLPDPATSQGSNDTTNGAAAYTPLVNNYEVVNIQSVSTLATMRKQTRRPISPVKAVAVFADPVFDSNDDRVLSKNDQPSSKETTAQYALRDFRPSTRKGAVRLSNSAREAKAILEVMPRGSAFVATGFAATRQEVMSDAVAEYQILHFATHGSVNNEHPELSGVVLTMVNTDGTDATGFLQMHDIYKLKLSSNLVVLSACDSALGKDINGEGVVGLTRAFMQAGARSVVASLWKIDDKATSVFMQHFYSAMIERGMTPAAALRSAKQSMRKEPRWSAPYYWAGFILQGEYRNHIVVGSDRFWQRPAAVGVSVVLLSLLSFMAFRNRRVA